MDDNEMPDHLRKFQEAWGVGSVDPEVRVQIGKLFRAMQWYPDSKTIDTWIEYLSDLPKENILIAIDSVIKNNQKKNSSIAELRYLAGKSGGKSVSKLVDEKLAEKAIAETTRRKTYASKAVDIIKARAIPSVRVNEYIKKYFSKVYGPNFQSNAKENNIELNQFKYMALADWLASNFDENKAIKLALSRPDSNKIRKDLILKYSK